MREAHKDRFKAEEGVGLTYTTFLAAAVCETLKRHPYINAEVQGDKIRFKKDVHLGIAVAITDPEPGLIVPVIRGADQMNLRGLARSIADLASRVRSRKIKLEISRCQPRRRRAIRIYARRVSEYDLIEYPAREGISQSTG